MQPLPIEITSSGAIRKPLFFSIRNVRVDSTQVELKIVTQQLQITFQVVLQQPYISLHKGDVDWWTASSARIRNTWALRLPKCPSVEYGMLPWPWPIITITPTPGFSGMPLQVNLQVTLMKLRASPSKWFRKQENQAKETIILVFAYNRR